MMMINIETECGAKFLAVLWSIWKRRNEAVWNDTVMGAEETVRTANSMLDTWQRANTETGRLSVVPRQQATASRWRKPFSGWVKINVDRAVNQTSGIRAWGWIARDENGQFIRAGGGSAEKDWSVEETEARGLRKAVEVAAAAGWLRVEFESDSLRVVDNINKTSIGNSYIDLILDDIRSILATKSNWSVSFCKRSANTVAHALARSRVNLSDHSVIFYSSPTCIESQLANDLLI
ncbi:unnamed protein product [Cuscuta epithymum]|uniref:RNase H type-1 domain-containing protein n=1 Tax=Cuscuta epithymum TaxID=186058 RepID=A0AAV0GB40_9ASTE|nr:unnamed protein product [Cuscuta epithymum]